jgi:hypothetical protein
MRRGKVVGEVARDYNGEPERTKPPPRASDCLGIAATADESIHFRFLPCPSISVLRDYDRRNPVSCYDAVSLR